ncbi:MAG: amidohydrolase family protein [Steroidobacteraceae bacterium]
MNSTRRHGSASALAGWLAWLALLVAGAGLTPTVSDGAAMSTRTLSAPRQLRLVFESLVDGTGERLAGREIVIEGRTIVAIGSGLKRRYPAARRITLPGLTAIPGLIDAHVHMTYGFCAASRGDPWKQLLNETPPQERLLAGIDNAARTLAVGVTTARDLLALDGVDFELRELIDHGVVPGPRLYLSGVGIHPLTMPLGAGGTPDERVAAFSQRAREVVASKASWLKIFATTGTGADLTGEQIYQYPEIKAAVDIAHAGGVRVAVHAYGPSVVPEAIRAGVDSIEHSVGVDDETLRSWAASGVFYVPTVDHNRYYAEHRLEYGYDADAARALQAFVERNLDMLGRAHRAGVPIAMGSDAVMTMFGENTRELEWFVAAGFTPAEALRAATVDGARLLGQQDRLGRLVPGFMADIVGVRGTPLADIRAVTRQVVWVMKDGKVEIDRRSSGRPAAAAGSACRAPAGR